LATFHQAARCGRDNQSFAPRNLKEEAYLLRRLVRCGRCGSSCSAIASKQISAGQPHTSHYYVCSRKNSGFLKQERCGQRQIRADVLDEMVWEEVNVRLQDPKLVYEAYQERHTHDSDPGRSTLDEPDRRVEEQLKGANKELSRLLDAYQCGAIELTELQRRRKLIDSKLGLLTREKEVLARMAQEQQRDADMQNGLEEFATLVSKNLRHFSFENRQKLLRIVVDKVVVKDWRVDVFYNIPLPQPSPPPKKTSVSGKVSLCSVSNDMPPVTFANRKPAATTARHNRRWLRRCVRHHGHNNTHICHEPTSRSKHSSASNSSSIASMMTSSIASSEIWTRKSLRIAEINAGSSPMPKSPSSQARTASSDESALNFSSRFLCCGCIKI